MSIIVSRLPVTVVAIAGSISSSLIILFMYFIFNENNLKKQILYSFLTFVFSLLVIF